MGRRSLNRFLFLAFVASLGVHVVIGRDLTERNFEFLADMAHSPAYDSYASNPNFPDGKTFQMPQPGTIARGQRPFHYGPSPAEAVRAGRELRNPLPAGDPLAQKRGATVYRNYCLLCHGPAGKGDGPVSQRGGPIPSSLVAENAVQMKDGQMFHVLTFGQKNMPAQSGLLSQEDRWKVIRYIRSLQQQAAGVKGP